MARASCVRTTPLDVGCVVITDTAVRVVTRSFNVTPGRTASLTMGNLPVGPSSFDAVAYAGSCPPAAQAQATWATAQSTRVNIQAGLVASLQLVLQQVGGANIGLTFADGGVTGSDGGC